MKVTANKPGFALGKLQAEGVTFEFDVKINEDGTNNLGSWMDCDPKELKKLETAAKKKQKKASETEEAEEAVVTEIE